MYPARRETDVGESSRQGSRQRLRLLDDIVPNFLNFSSVNPANMMCRYKRKLEKLLKKDIRSAGVIDWNLFKNEGENSPMYDDISYFLDVDFKMGGHVIFESQVWRKLFQINEPNYKELILEFFSTYSFKNKTDFKDKTAMQFRLGGKQRSLSIIQFSRILDIYPPEVVSNAGFNSILENTHIMINDEKTLKDWWLTVSTGEYVYKVSSTIDIIDPVISLFHHLLVSTFCSRRDVTMRVTKEDLSLLYCIANRQHVNVPFWIARYLTKATNDKPTYPITGGGQYITRLARYFGILTVPTIRTLTQLDPMMILDKSYWLRLGICRENPDDNSKLKWASRYHVEYSAGIAQEHGHVAMEMEQTGRDVPVEVAEQEELLGNFTEQGGIIATQGSEAEDPFQDLDFEWLTSMIGESSQQTGASQNLTLEERMTLLELEVKRLKVEVESIKKLLNNQGEKQIQDGWNITLNRTRIGEQAQLQEVMNRQVEWLHRRFEQIFPPDELLGDPWPTIFQSQQPPNPPE